MAYNKRIGDGSADVATSHIFPFANESANLNIKIRISPVNCPNFIKFSNIRKEGIDIY
jgi:hypothetical protein